ncbi:hypothetical protein ACLKA6_015423 [Drosophila palustris]
MHHLPSEIRWELLQSMPCCSWLLLIGSEIDWADVCISILSAFHLQDSSQAAEDSCRIRVVKVSMLVVHKDYGNFLNDVAVLFLEESLSYSAVIRAIPLAELHQLHLLPSGLDC